MENENKKSNIESLGKSWLDKVKNIRRKARTDFEFSKNVPTLARAEEVVDANELFTGDVSKELTAKHVFAGDDDFHNFLENSANPTGHSAIKSKSDKNFRHFSILQAVVIGVIAATVIIVIWIVAKTPSQSTAATVNDTAQQYSQVLKQMQLQIQQAATATPSQSKPAITREEQPELTTPTQPISLKLAQDFYLDDNYDGAINAYEKLYDSLINRPDAIMMRDYLQMQIGLCKEKTGQIKKACHIFRRTAQSQSPLVRVISNYHLSLFDMNNKDYPQSRICAYRALSLIDSLGLDGQMKDSLRRDCEFLAAQAISLEALALCNGDKELPEELWGKHKTVNEMIARMDKAELEILLRCGTEKLATAILAPAIHHVSKENGIDRYLVTCRGVSFEELISRFANNIGVNVTWNLNSDAVGTRNRSVYLHLEHTVKTNFLTTAAGSVGLLANVSEDGTINISNPRVYSDMAAHVAQLNSEAISLWERFRQAFHKDNNLANIHYILGVLKTQMSLTNEAIAEYKLIANRFSRSSLAPSALLEMSDLKNQINDTAGARADLKQLVEQYPDADITERAYLSLANNTAAAGLVKEAATIYKKIYNISPYIKSQKIASLGAGKCFYETADYESAATWLDRHIKLISNQQEHDSYIAFYLLGKTYQALGNSALACEALNSALDGNPPDKKYVEILNALVSEHIKAVELIEAMGVLENIRLAKFSPTEATEILLLKSKVLRSMGLGDSAIALLGDRSENTIDMTLKAKLCFEIAKCYIDKGLLSLASDQLSAILLEVEAGDFANEVMMEMANVCFKMGNNGKAISICQGLLDIEPNNELKQKALAILAASHKKQKNYEKAALALIGQWK